MTLKSTLTNQVVGLHRTFYRLSGGRVLADFGGMPVIELSTTGARSGKTRTTMLTVPVRYRGDMVVIASKGGADENPAWYHNVVAHPGVTVTEKGTSTTLKARVLTPEEREELWPQIVTAYKGYGGYQEKTSRTIPVVVLEAS